MTARKAVRVQFDCGHRAKIDRDEYGDGSAWCPICGEFQVYARCRVCFSLDCQALDGPVLPGDPLIITTNSGSVSAVGGEGT